MLKSGGSEEDPLLEINYTNSSGYTALFSAATENKNEKIFRYLLLHGANFYPEEEETAFDDDNRSYFYTPECFLDIVTSGNLQALKFIMRYIEQKPIEERTKFTIVTDKNKRNALMIAAKKSTEYPDKPYRDMLPYLLMLGFDLSIEDSDRHRALYYLARSRFKLIPPHRGSPNRDVAVQEAYTRDQLARDKLVEGMKALATLLQEEVDAIRLDADESWFFRDVLLSHSRDGRGNIADILACVASDWKPAGKTSRRFLNTLSRPYRSFCGERDRQLLRQISTQLYFKLKETAKSQEGIEGAINELAASHVSSPEGAAVLNRGEAPVTPSKPKEVAEASKPPQVRSSDVIEVEAMYLEVGSNSYLFIGINKWSASQLLLQVISNIGALKTILCTPFDEVFNRGEGKERSERYAAKFKTRVFINDKPLTYSYFQDKKASVREVAKDVERAHNIAELLRIGEICTLSLCNDSEKNLAEVKKCLEPDRAKRIFLVKVTEEPSFSDKHAEEFFADIIKHVADIAEDAKRSLDDIYSCVGGKKRPCISCFGRMTGEITRHGQYPGLFWKGTMVEQEQRVALRTIDTLLTKQPCVSLCKDGRREDSEFDSGSDSEAEASTLSRS